MLFGQVPCGKEKKTATHRGRKERISFYRGKTKTCNKFEGVEELFVLLELLYITTDHMHIGALQYNKIRLKAVYVI